MFGKHKYGSIWHIDFGDGTARCGNPRKFEVMTDSIPYFPQPEAQQLCEACYSWQREFSGEENPFRITLDTSMVSRDTVSN